MYRESVTWAQRMPKSTQQVNKSQYSTCYLIKSLLVGYPVSGSQRHPGWGSKLLLRSRKERLRP